MIHKDLEMAKKALEKVKSVKESEDKNTIAEYHKIVKGLGSMIIQNGLAGTVLFLKGKNKMETVINHLDELIEYRIKIKKFSEKVIDNGDQLDSQEYLKAQIAALEAVKWLRRYADILLGGEKT